MKRKIRIDNQLLISDRKALGLSQDSLVIISQEAKGPSFSLGSLQRAEKEGRATRPMIQLIAKSIGKSAERYILQEYSQPALNLSGDWIAAYIEDDINTSPYFVFDKIEITQLTGPIIGVYVPWKSEHPEGYVRKTKFLFECRTGGKMIYGTYREEHGRNNLGAGCFQLIETRNSEWLDGYCTFYDDIGKITISPHAWIKRSARTYQMHQKQLRDEFCKRIKAYKEINKV